MRTSLERLAFALALPLLVLGARPAGRPEAGPAGARVLAVRLTGVVSPVMDDILDEAIARARSGAYRALLVELNTPGGLESSMRDMVGSELASPVPILVWVTPGGAHAASAGVFITLAADVAAMSPGTNIGAATPISLQGPMDSTLARKATNDAAAQEAPEVLITVHALQYAPEQAQPQLALRQVTRAPSPWLVRLDCLAGLQRGKGRGHLRLQVLTQQRGTRDVCCIMHQRIFLSSWNFF